ncbi:type II secretion system protein GspL [Alteromonas sp. a30]|uniref:type II secretion system protein GspL n=1 Tax=Alteromonas sp. a30 TaxID=2730917 RepID=UPI00227EE0C0|nr:type II secretion system protein GspL [Alteromonas sp. a30]MCY7295664.1 type II secretion system protein GspL [Alteromonas sp. a30]
MEQLVIRLGSQIQEPVNWLVWSAEQNEIIASGVLPDASELSTLRDRAGNRSIIALVPGSDVLLKQITLPAKVGSKALAAIPFMLEDDVTTDIESTYFAIGGREGELQNIAVVQKEKMHFWIDTMNEAGLSCSRLVPDVLALPHVEGAWTAMMLGNEILLRQSHWQGVQGEVSWMIPAIAHLTKHQEEKVVIQNLTELEIPAIPNTELQPDISALPMEVLAKGAMASSFNLLQGEFRPKQNTNGGFKKWRLAAILAGVSLLATLADKGWQASHYSSESNALKAEIQEEFRRAFPEVRRIVSVRKQMNQKMQVLEGSSGGTSMLVMLSQLSPAFSSSKVKPQTIRFDRNRAEIRLQAVASNFESLEKFKTLAEQQGFEVQQGAINNRDDLVMGSLIIRS